jgi:hypothetical protein
MSIATVNRNCKIIKEDVSRYSSVDGIAVVDSQYTIIHDPAKENSDSSTREKILITDAQGNPLKKFITFDSNGLPMSQTYTYEYYPD